MNQEAQTVGAGREAAIYVRAPQHNELDRTTVEEQLEACRTLAERLGYSVGDRGVLSDDAPNTTANRPGLIALLGQAARGEIASVVVYKLPRLVQANSAMQDAFLKELRRREIPLYVAATPKGYGYDPATGRIEHDDAEVAEANLEEWRPPTHYVIPREDELLG